MKETLETLKGMQAFYGDVVETFRRHHDPLVCERAGERDALTRAIAVIEAATEFTALMIDDNLSADVRHAMSKAEEDALDRLISAIKEA